MRRKIQPFKRRRETFPHSSRSGTDGSIDFALLHCQFLAAAIKLGDRQHWQGKVVGEVNIAERIDEATRWIEKKAKAINFGRFLLVISPIVYVLAIVTLKKSDNRLRYSWYAVYCREVHCFECPLWVYPVKKLQNAFALTLANVQCSAIDHSPQ